MPIYPKGTLPAWVHSRGVYTIRNHGGDKPFTVRLRGRQDEFFREMLKTGHLDCPSTRRNSSIVHRLRCKGIAIDTQLLPSVNAEGGRYGRYWLRASVIESPLKAEEDAK